MHFWLPHKKLLSPEHDVQLSSSLLVVAKRSAVAAMRRQNALAAATLELRVGTRTVGSDDSQDAVVVVVVAVEYTAPVPGFIAIAVDPGTGAVAVSAAHAVVALLPEPHAASVRAQDRIVCARRAVEFVAEVVAVVVTVAAIGHLIDALAVGAGECR
jgi:hypothetical protein